jgi:hypothetical protein
MTLLVFLLQVAYQWRTCWSLCRVLRWHFCTLGLDMFFRGVAYRSSSGVSLGLVGGYMLVSTGVSGVALRWVRVWLSSLHWLTYSTRFYFIFKMLLRSSVIYWDTYTPFLPDPDHDEKQRAKDEA